MNQIPEGTTQLPPQFSTIAPLVDEMYMLVYWVSVAFTVVIVAAMLYFMWKYRRRPGVKAKATGHSTAMEILWTFTPLVLLGVLFHQGFEGYVYGAVAPEDSIEIRVRASQWSWEFEHRNGFIETNTLTAPAGTPVKLIMSSSDVLHSFYIPTMRVKRDVVPGMYSSLWFESTVRTDDIADGSEQACTVDAECPEGFWCGGRVGEEDRTCSIPIFCTEYCGAPHGGILSAFDDPDGQGRNANHSTMMADLHLIPVADYDQFLRDNNAGPRPPDDAVVEEPAVNAYREANPRELELATAFDADPTAEPPRYFRFGTPPNEDAEDTRPWVDGVAWGQALHAQQCGTCHAVDGETQSVGPNWAIIWGNERPIVGGPAEQGDAAYIRQSINNPQSQIAAGYESAGNMSVFRFTDAQLNAVVAYMRSLSE